MSVTIEMTGDEVRLLQSFQRTIEKQQRIIDQLRKTRDEGKKAKNSLGEAFGRRALGDLRNYITGLVSVTATVGLVGKALREVDAVASGAGTRITDAITGRRALTQVASTTREYENLLDVVKHVRTEFGLGATEAYKLAFSAASAGPEFIEQIDLLARLPEIGFEPSAGVEAAQKLQSAFGGTGKGAAGAGELRDVLNKVLAAAGPSPVMASEIARAASIASLSWAGIGGQDEALLALLGTMSEVTKSPEAAGEKIKSLADQLAKKRHLIDLSGGFEELKGLELIGNLDTLAKQGRLKTESGESVDVRRFLGESNAVQALEFYRRQTGKIAQRLGDVVQAERLSGTEEGLLARKFGMVKEDLPSESVKQKETQTQRTEVQTEEAFGSLRNLITAVTEDEIAQLRDRGVPEWALVAERGANWAQRMLLGPEKYLEVHSQDIRDPELQKTVLKALEEANRQRGEANRQREQIARNTRGSIETSPDATANR